MMGAKLGEKAQARELGGWSWCVDEWGRRQDLQ